ncbi:hypothetical protein BDR03DRAFT_937788 [Suillus americanus]|nr:hypothetical protein BDR03DRAFT_937788 [Suillus americanus]
MPSEAPSFAPNCSQSSARDDVRCDLRKVDLNHYTFFASIRLSLSSLGVLFGGTLYVVHSFESEQSSTVCP